MRTTTIRVTVDTRERLNSLARRRGRSAIDVVAELVQEADDEALLEAAAQGWAALAVDPAYPKETRELEEFDTALPEY